MSVEHKMNNKLQEKIDFILQQNHKGSENSIFSILKYKGGTIFLSIVININQMEKGDWLF